MRSRAEIKRDRFNSIVLSKKLSEILTAYFNVDRHTPFKDLLSNHEDTFRFWAHEFDYNYDDLIKLCRMFYHDVMNFNITDRKVMTGYKESYGSWVIFGKNGIFILWDVI